MAERRCPNCGELVPNNSITCPKCFKKIPNNPQPSENSGSGSPKGRTRTGRSRKLMMFLTIVPAFVGLLGLGLIYKDPKRKRRYIALGLGLLIFVGAVAATVSLVLIPLAVPFWILYVLLFLACAFFTLFADFEARVF